MKPSALLIMNNINLHNLIVLSMSVIVGLGIGLLGFLLARLVSPRKDLPLKQLRYECGNKPLGRARGWYAMQYYAFLILFLTVEPISIYLFILLIMANTALIDVSILFLLILGMLAPTLYFGVKVAGRVKLWLMED